MRKNQVIEFCLIFIFTLLLSSTSADFEGVKVGDQFEFVYTNYIHRHQTFRNDGEIQNESEVGLPEKGNFVYTLTEPFTATIREIDHNLATSVEIDNGINSTTNNITPGFARQLVIGDNPSEYLMDKHERQDFRMDLEYWNDNFVIHQDTYEVINRGNEIGFHEVLDYTLYTSTGEWSNNLTINHKEIYELKTGMALKLNYSSTSPNNFDVAISHSISYDITEQIRLGYEEPTTAKEKTFLEESGTPMAVIITLLLFGVYIFYKKYASSKKV